MKKCINCKKEIADDAKVCMHCGTDQKPDAMDSYINKMSPETADYLKAKNIQSKEMLAGLEQQVYTTDTAEQPGIKSEHQALDDIFDSDFIMPDKEHVTNLFEIARNSPYIQNNLAFKQLAAIIRFEYDEDNTDKRSQAGAMTFLEKEGELLIPVIYIPGNYTSGFCHAVFWVLADRFVGSQRQSWFARSLLEPTSRPPYLEFHVREKVELTKEQLNNISKIYDEQGRELVDAAIITTIAHEFGHICYSHLVQTDLRSLPFHVQRNIERDADSFALSALVGTPFEHLVFEGEFYSHYMDALRHKTMEKFSGFRPDDMTHPHAIERLRNTIRANPEIANEYGVSEEMVDKYFLS